MTTQQLISQIQQKKSFLCIGLDVDLNKIPKHLLDTDDPIFEFNKAIIDATPVSYTHLDVYKRQDINRSKFSFIS